MGEGLFLYFAGVGDLVVVLTTALGVGKRKGGGGGGGGGTCLSRRTRRLEFNYFNAILDICLHSSRPLQSEVNSFRGQRRQRKKSLKDFG